MAFTPSASATTPQLGASCIGAEIGRTAVDAHGNKLICDNYVWRLNRGQQPRHKWADDQRAWTECTEHHSVTYCRHLLNH
ncbi:hypothetical protein QSJ18_20000 [Gordonia sp. ABSL1-1]|uniref:hypothetical protein n=1 Tax=Gordonia sp. ABSL1-1 TaxID=3053923 RepID=UPI002573769B|nr:hypothetical protein [Gordonia sp. ABSL1-1]MDL9939031.1 hypothetical protein [Gordonia sp. ABSL1-1]